MRRGRRRRPRHDAGRGQGGAGDGGARGGHTRRWGCPRSCDPSGGGSFRPAMPARSRPRSTSCSGFPSSSELRWGGPAGSGCRALRRPPRGGAARAPGGRRRPPMSGAAAPPSVLRLTPAFDWRGLDGELGAALRHRRWRPGAGAAPDDGARGARRAADRVVAAAAGGSGRGSAGRRRGAPGSGRARSERPGARVRADGRQLAWGRGVRTDLRRRPPAADLIHVHGTCAPWPLRVALAAQRRLGLPLVVTVHCSITATYAPASRRDAGFQRYARRVERTALARSARTLVLTRRVRDGLLAAGLGAPERVGVMPDLVDVAGLPGGHAHRRPRRRRAPWRARRPLGRALPRPVVAGEGLVGPRRPRPGAARAWGSAARGLRGR